MRIAPVFLAHHKVNNNKGQNFSKLAFNNSLRKSQCDDVFLRLADASTRDLRIENELKSMGLI